MAVLVQVRNVPEAVRSVLKARAAGRGQSLNSYLLEMLAREAARPSVREVLDRASRRAGGSSVSALDAVHAGRQEREEQLDRRLP